MSCLGIKKDGNKCTYLAKENGYCGIHNPDKPKQSAVRSKNLMKNYNQRLANLSNN